MPGRSKDSRPTAAGRGQRHQASDTPPVAPHGHFSKPGYGLAEGHEPVDAWHHPAPPAWLWRACLSVALVAIAALLAWQVMSQLFDLFMLMVCALFVSLAIEPPVNWLTHKGWRRGLATGAVMVGVLAVAGAAMAALGQMFVEQVVDLVKGIPDMYKQVADWASNRFDVDIPTQNEALTQLASSWGKNLAGTAWAAGTTLFSALLSALGLLLMVYYFSARGKDFRAAICAPLRPRQQYLVLQVWATAQDKTAGYIASRVILALFNAVATCAFLLIVRVPYALPLALFCGVVSQFVPTVGTYLGGALPVLIGLGQKPITGLLVLVFIVAYQQVENFLLAPKLTSKTMEINPAVAFISVIALGTVLGPMGAFLSLPLVATVQAVVSSYLHRYELVDSELLREEPRPVRTRPEHPAAAAGPGDGGTWLAPGEDMVPPEGLVG
ncbi:MAG: AI-2E family transporter [Bifidobacteriaceae bacterium]|jgi:predicted PurR-regulated permease PerM|nr:AI-2E family transporter [Bifidobacteriaceae bacterium]